MILRKSGDTTVINQGSEGGGGGGGSVALGPLLTSLNAEAMPSSEGYLHWTGSAWAFDTPTGGDPVDLTPYALKTWVQDNFAYKNDLVNFITKTEADTYYAALSHSHDNYLPLSAGPNKALTGSLYFSGNSGINWAGGVGMLACTPESGWTGISSSQWGVGALSAQGVIRSNANDILHYRNGNSYKIWDAYNFTPSDYLPLTGGTVESLTVTNGLDADSITVSSIVNSNTLAEYLDQDASDARYLQLTGGTLTGRLVAGSGVYFGTNGNQGGVYYDNGLVVGGNAVRILSDGVFTHNGSNVVTESSLPSLLPFSYLRNSASDDDEQLGTISKLILPLTVAADGTGKKYAQLNLSNYATTSALNTALAGYLPLAGGAMTGNISFKGTGGTNEMIRFINSGLSEGNGIVIGGGGATIIGGGESVVQMAAQVQGWNEVMYIGNDQNVSIFTNLQKGWDYRKEFTFHKTGVLHTAGSVVTPNGSGLYIEDTGGTGQVAVFVNDINQFFVGFGMRNAGYTGYFDSYVMHLRSGASGITMTLDASNNVGIGTTSPAEKLDVAGNVKAYGATLTNLLSWNVQNADNLVISNNKIQMSVSGTPHNIVLFEGSTANMTSYAKFYERPMVNTGTNNGTPVYTNVALVSEVEAKQDIIHFQNTNNNDSEVGFSYLHLPLTEIGAGHASLDLSSYMPLSGDSIKTGKLAVGTTAFDGSNAKLQVGGNMFATGSITSKSSAGSVTLGNGNISATNLYISTVVFGTSNNDPAIYIGNGHVYARNSQGQTTMII